MTYTDFKDKKVLVMGLGLQGGGVGVAKFFAQKGAQVTVTDLKTETELSSSINSLKEFSINYVLGEHREEDFKNTNLVIRNPDVPRDSKYLAIARENNIPVEMDESLFLKLCPFTKNIIGVTGTRGKTTTTTLIAEILDKTGYKVLKGGNLRGVATLSLLDKVTVDSLIVLELSSWQLQGLDESRISPHIAVITNIFPDHLNRYKTMEDYVSDKKIIFKYQTEKDYLILNKNDNTSGDFAAEAKSKIIWFESQNLPPEIIKVFHLKGYHNLNNLAAAYEVAKIFSVEDEKIASAVNLFGGVPFRLEEIAVKEGVAYVNDTTSTMPEATIAALKAYQGKPIILICGGSSKNLDFTKLAKEVGESVKAVVFLEGSATDDLVSHITSHLSPKQNLGRFNDLKQAVLTAKGTAKPGDIILLSPACPSFGLFQNEFDRGEQFNDVVGTL